MEKSTRTKTRENWLIVVENSKILGAGRVKKTDWYEWTLKNIFTVPKARGRGVATRLYKKLTDKAKKEGAHVAEADITSDNVSSKVPAVKAGMYPVDSFKWDEGEKYADVYHETFNPPSEEKVREVNSEIWEGFMDRGKKVPSDVYSPGSPSSEEDEGFAEKIFGEEGEFDNFFDELI